MTSDTVIEIAGIPILLRSRDSVFEPAVRKYYADFITPVASVAPVELTVEVDASGFPDPETVGAGGAVPVVDVAWTGDRWRLERFDFRGEWSPGTGRGQVCLAQPQALQSIDSVLRILHSILAVPPGGCLVHAASAVRNGSAFVFPGVSGAGKSTLSGLIPSDATLLTDEISYVRPAEGGYRAFGTPFAGNLGAPGKNVSAPLKAVYLLAKGPKNKIDPLSRKEAATALLRNVLFFAKDPELIRTVFETVCRLVASVPVYRLTFLPTPEVWEIIA